MFQQRNQTAARQLQKVLIATVQDKGTKPYDRAFCSRIWIELEAYKREIGGVPRLATVSLSELANLRRRAPKPALVTDITELDAKESISTQTVPTPPTPMPQAGGGDLNNKPPHHPQQFVESPRKSSPSVPTQSSGKATGKHSDVPGSSSPGSAVTEAPVPDSVAELASGESAQVPSEGGMSPTGRQGGGSGIEDTFSPKDGPLEP